MLLALVSVNCKTPGERFEAAPITVQSGSGTVKFVVNRTLKVAFRLALVKPNWNTPLVTILALMSFGGGTTPVCVTGIFSPSSVMSPVRLAVVLLAVKLKVTTPPVTLAMLNQGWLTVGLNGTSRFSPAYSTTGKTSLPAAFPSIWGVGST